MATESISIIISILVLLISGASNSYSYPVSVHATSAYGPAEDGKGCGSALGILYPCYDFVTNGEIKNPTPQCCVALSTTVYTNQLCLCFLFADVLTTYGDLINESQAYLLPTLCNVPVPSVAICVTRYLSNVPNAPVSDSSPVPNNRANRNQGLSPPKIHVSAPQSVNSKAIGETINTRG